MRNLKKAVTAKTRHPCILLFLALRAGLSKNRWLTQFFTARSIPMLQSLNPLKINNY